MKRALFLISFIVVVLFAFDAGAAKLSFSSVNITPGGKSDLDVLIIEADRAYSGVNMSVKLPEGVTVSSVSKGDLLSTGSFEVEHHAYDGGVRILIYSATDTFSSDGKILKIELSAAVDATPGNYNIEFEDNSNTLINSSHGISGQYGVFSADHEVEEVSLTINNGDSDNDQIADAWENEHFGNLDHTGAEDSDNDGLTDLQEYQNSTNPNSADSDSDGMTDGWEVVNGLNPNLDDSSLDSDLDGFSNLAEFLAGTNPADINDVPSNLIITEDFETGDLKKLNWVITYKPWMVTGADPNNGFNAVESASIGDKEESTLEITMYCEQGELSFWYKVSSEEDYDFLKFYIDDELKGGWSGEIEYTQAKFNILQGRHTFKWVYSKDGSDSSGEDLAMLDDIVFPGSIDSDSDNMPNSWEVKYGLDPMENDALEDLDGDGYTNYAEFVADTDPNDSGSFPVVTDISENFELGSFSLPFIISGDGKWNITENEGYNLTKGLVSSPVADKKKVILEKNLYCEQGNVSFKVAVSSEVYDYVYFYIDDVLKGNWSGEVSFTEVSYPVTQGMHNFKWVYSKDGSDSAGSDNAKLDDIKFPGSLDSDNDKLPDGWEIANGLNPLYNDANEDPDLDGFTNLHEYLSNTNPKVADASVSYPLPVSNAGVEQNVGLGDDVSLDGSTSVSANSIVKYKWKQISGITVELSDSAVVNPTFTAPSEADELIFELTVEDAGGMTHSSTVKITVN